MAVGVVVVERVWEEKAMLWMRLSMSLRVYIVEEGVEEGVREPAETAINNTIKTAIINIILIKRKFLFINDNYTEI